MDDTEAVAAALRALVDSGATVRTKTGRLRELLPEIEAMRKLGISHAQILQVLNERGLDMTPKVYSVTLHRIRNAKPKKGDAVPKGPRKDAHDAPTPISEPAPPGAVEDEWNESSEEVKKRREDKAKLYIRDENRFFTKMKGNNK